MFWGMIAPEKPPLRIAKITSSTVSVRWSKSGPCTRWLRLALPWVPAAESVWQPEQRSAKISAPSWTAADRSRRDVYALAAAADGQRGPGDCDQ